MDDKIKTIVDYYVLAKNTSKKNKVKSLKYCEKILLLINEINSDNTEIQKIKNYAVESINDSFDHLLIKNTKKAPETIFKIVDNGDLIKLESLTETEYDYKIFDSDGNTPMHQCIKNGDSSMLKEFLKNGQSIDTTNNNGNTLLEYACSLKNPSMINFLILHGADVNKHLNFREENIKSKLRIDDIDCGNIMKICFLSNKNTNKLDLTFLYRYIDKNFKIGINDIIFKDFLPFLEKTLSNLDKDKLVTLATIWKEELSESLENNLGCPDNKFEILLINMVPFIDYKFNISNKNVVLNELIFLIKKCSKDNDYILDDNFNNSVLLKLEKDYKNIFPMEFLGVLIYQILLKLKTQINK